MRLKTLAYLVQSLGFDPRRLFASILSVPAYVRAYARVVRTRNPDWPITAFPALGDRGEQAGSARGHYFHMDLWAARKVYAGQFDKLVDVGSRVDGYVAHVLSFRDIECFDVRPMVSSVSGLTFVQADLTSSTELPKRYADCVSCLHALEHFGLGRYGDPLDLDGWRKGLHGLVEVLKRGGSLLLAVPVGRQRIEFDAHRVFDPQTILREATSIGLELQEFSLVDDQGELHNDVTPDMTSSLDYGCGCFHFKLK